MVINVLNTWDRFIENINKDLKLFAFLLIIICIFRIYFMFYMSGFMGDETGISDVMQALWAGLRISLKSAGIFAAVTFVFCTLPNLLLKKVNFDKVRIVTGSIAVFVLSVFFQGRFPYYKAYNSTYGMQVVNGADDDIQAILVMMIQEYGLVWRLMIAFILTAVGVWLWKRLLAGRNVSINIKSLSKAKKRVVYAVTPILCFMFCLFIRFGGSFNYEHSINWENAGITKDTFLNECILDDVQALYRAFMMKEAMAMGSITGVDKENILEYSKEIAGNNNINSNQISDYITHTAKGPIIPKPKHIFIIMGESMSQWPLMDKYAYLNIADDIKALSKEDNAYVTPYFISNGEFTSIALTGMITGLCDIGMRVNCQPRSFQEIYVTSMAPQFKRLGYQVNFWYGGIPSWDNMNKLAKAQGFDNYWGMPDFNAPRQSIWGTKDEFLFKAVKDYVSADGMDVNVIMTTTNHPPYNLDLNSEGFDLSALKKKTAEMENVDDSDTLAVELAHYWYMNKEIAKFVHETYTKCPESIFIITGDHAVRVNPSNNPTMYEHKSVPFILYGQGINKDILPKDAVGGHMSILPTLMELIAPQGFKYQSLAYSMTDKDKAIASFNSSAWITDSMMGNVEGNGYEYLFNKKDTTYEFEKAKVEKSINMMRTIAWWLVAEGNLIK